MGGYNNRLDLDGEIDAIWGSSGDDSLGLFRLFSVSAGYSVAGNPMYSATDFFTAMPNFAGQATHITGTLDGTTTTITAVSSILGLAVGQYIAGIGIPSGATISSAISAGGSNTVTISAPVTVAGTPVALTVYTAPLIPAAVLNAYIALATGSLSSQLWGQLWPLAMAYYIAHFCTLWAQGQGKVASTAAQLAGQGLAIGIKTSKAAGNVSVGSTPLIMDGAGAYALTIYGQQFYTWAQAIGSGSMLIW